MDIDERHEMREQAREPKIEDYLPPFYIPQENECLKCGSMNTFKTFDKKLVCRECWKVSDEIIRSADDIDQKIWEQEYDKLPGRVKHI